MKSFYASVIATTALFGASTVLAGEQTAEGCFSSSTGLIFNSTDTFNSKGYCGGACLAQQYAVFAMTNSSYCFCSQTLPPASSLADDDDCTISCPGYPDDSCGANGYWNVYLTGLTTSVKNAAAGSSDSSSATTSTSSSATPKATTASVVTVGGQTVVITAASSATSTAAAAAATTSEASKKGGSNTAGIAAGVVVGVVVIAAILGGLWYFMRNRKRREIEEEYKRNAAVSSFIAGGNGKPPASSGGSSFNDTRLDSAAMAQRRESNGSIADNQDYSRRILKVTNA